MTALGGTLAILIVVWLLSIGNPNSPEQNSARIIKKYRREMDRESAAKALAAERAWQDGYIHPNYDVMRLHNARVKAVRVLTGTEPNRVVGWLSFTGLGIVLFVLYAVFA